MTSSGGPSMFRGVPAVEDVRRQVTRGRSARFALDPQLNWQQTDAAARDLRSKLARDDLLIIAHPGNQPSLTILQLISADDAARLCGRLKSLVEEFRVSARELVADFKRLVEPAYERGDEYPDSIELDDGTWSLDIHGEHCRFQNVASGAVVEAHTDYPDALDPGFLLLFAETTGHYSDLQAACIEGFHDMSRMLTLANLNQSG